MKSKQKKTLDYSERLWLHHAQKHPNMVKPGKINSTLQKYLCDSQNATHARETGQTQLARAGQITDLCSQRNET